MYGWQVEEERYAATQAEAHREWHRNSGEKYGCPWDACEPPEPDHCNVCGDYVDDDGRCARSEDEHALLVAEQMSEQLAAGPGPTNVELEPDPWF